MKTLALVSLLTAFFAHSTVHAQMMIRPLVVIITSPQDYAGKEVNTVGFLNEDANMLYLSRDSYEARDMSSAVPIFNLPIRSLKNTPCYLTHVRVIGTFDRSERFGYRFTNVKFITNSVTDAPCYEAPKSDSPGSDQAN